MTEVLTSKTFAGLNVQAVQERSSYYNMLFYGDSGTGKTVLAGSADAVPAMRPVLVVDIEGGTESLKHTYPQVEVVRVTTWKEMQQVYDELYLGNHEYRTIVLDSLTEIQKFSMYDIMGDLMVKHPDRDIDVPSMREWGINLEQTRKFVRGFRDLEMHTIFTALAKEDKNQRTGQVTTKPSLSGKMADEVAAFLDVVCYYYIKEVSGEFKRLLLTQKTDATIAKDRTGKLPQVIELPTMTQIHQLMQVANTETGE